MSKKSVLGKAGVRLATEWLALLVSAFLASALLIACNGPTPPTPTPGPPSAARGVYIFREFCNSCHPGGDRGTGPALKPLLPVMSDPQIRQIVRRGKAPMPGYNATVISDDDLTSLLLYLREMK